MQDSIKNPTKTKRTKDAYTKRALSDISSFQEEQGVKVDSEENARLFIQWLISLKPKMSMAYWRQRKAASVYYLEELGFMDSSSYLKTISSDGAYKYRTRADRKKKGKTSSRKEKKISADDLDTLHHFLSNDEKSRWSLPTLVFFRATLVTGLRPTEWSTSQYLKDYVDESGESLGPALKVKNAKSTNERSHGEYRHLLLSDLDEDSIVFVRGQLKYIVEKIGPGKMVKTFNEYYEAVRQRLANVVNRLWPSRRMRISLYTARHQFIADLKKAGYSRLEIAALVGHATDETAHAHYGKKKAGRRSTSLPKPLASEVERVRVIIGEVSAATLRDAKKDHGMRN